MSVVLEMDNDTAEFVMSALTVFAQGMADPEDDSGPEMTEQDKEDIQYAIAMAATVSTAICEALGSEEEKH